VAGRLLHKLFGSTAPPVPEVAAALEELERLAKERPELAGPIAVARDFLPSLYQEPLLDRAPALTNDHAAAKLAGGVPLLRGEHLDLDIHAFRRRWQRACAAVQAHRDDAEADQLAQALNNGTLELTALAEEFVAGGAQAILPRADALGLDAGLTATILRLTLFPVLERFNAALAALRDNATWAHGYCPTCGSWPLLGEFRGLEQTRFLRCGLCSAEWEFPRLCCVYCGTRDHHALGYLHVAGEESRYRATTCDACRGYIKMVATLGPLSGPQLFVAELATTHLDLAALAQNYLPQP
jgi:FdhE protein